MDRGRQMGTGRRIAPGTKDGNTVTRELKLSLIIGFVLVVVVAMLFSDYMSKANRSDLDNRLVSQPQLTHPAPKEPVVTLTTGHDSTTPESSPLAELAAANPATPQLVEPAPAVEIIQSREVAYAGDRSLEKAVRDIGGSITNGEIHTPPPLITPLKTPAKPGTGPKSNTLPADEPPKAFGPDLNRPSGLSEGIKKPAILDAPAQGTPAQPTKADREYTIADGDSAYLIAKKFYGKGELWRKLQAANPDRIGANGEVRVGAKIKVPQVASPIAKPAGPVVLDKVIDKPVAPAKPAGRTYTVKKGDSLQAIATRELKAATRADEILKLNADQLSNANVLKVGMVLKMPAK